uniref:Helicase C-terminal domain-containing protein n=1 Tax=Anopheles epiroticus TaxID=199890 RepID=A0A182PVD6_9DIPT
MNSKDRVQQLFTELIYDGLNVNATRSDRVQRGRDNVVRAIRRVKFESSSELISRGINFKGVNLVVNYDFPPSTVLNVRDVPVDPGKLPPSSQRMTLIAQLIQSAGGEVPDYMLQLHGSSKKERFLRSSGHRPRSDSSAKAK